MAYQHADLTRHRPIARFASPFRLAPNWGRRRARSSRGRGSSRRLSRAAWCSCPRTLCKCSSCARWAQARQARRQRAPGARHVRLVSVSANVGCCVCSVMHSALEAYVAALRPVSDTVTDRFISVMCMCECLCKCRCTCVCVCVCVCTSQHTSTLFASTLFEWA
jgi:hypothetical protein